jgi:2-desacetyl-2-hydroxyethyl bacteriochlorophyllide A dehydrogenase
VNNPCVTITAPREVELLDAPTPSPDRGQVLIRTAYSGVSAGTEMNVYRGVAPQWSQRQDPATGLFLGDQPEWSYPLVYGYANVGVVEELGPAVSGVSVGDTVFSYRPHCRRVVADATDVVPLPELPDLRRGVFLANLNTALTGVLDARPSLGSAVVVSGLGVIGLLVTQLVRRAGVGLLIGVDPVEQRRQLALEAGADLVYDPGEPVPELVRERTAGRGADIVIEVSGAPAALGQAIRTAGFNALVVAMSWYGGSFEGVTLSGEFHHNRVRIQSAQMGAVNPDLGPLWSIERRMALATELLAQLPLERYITHEFRPEHAGEAYAMLDRLAEPALQCVFDFGGAA